MRHTGRNQDGAVVATATRVALMWCRDAAPTVRADPEEALVSRFWTSARRSCSALPTAPSGSRRRSSARMPSSSTSRTPSRPTAKTAARGALIESELDPDARHRARQPARHRRLHRRPRDAVADRLPARSWSPRPRVGEAAQEHRPAVRGHRAVRDGQGRRARRALAALRQRDGADVGRGGSRREPRRHVEPQAERPLPRRRAHTPARACCSPRAPAARRRSTRCTSTSPRRSAWRSRRRMPRHPASPRPRASTRARSRSSARRTARTSKTVAGRTACWLPREGERGVFTYEGRMVDEPVLRHARAVLARGQSPSD